jgi:DNA polymerase-3 subunit gamma/tau
MLKTLEEPPEYVKFILATTDPQKVPVTVLSRCLQFNLKQMPPQAITARMREILTHEGIAAEDAALTLLAHAARGSMRDGLSLLDQAIAYAGGKVTLDAVRGMLGAIDQGTLVRVLDAIAARDAVRALAIADEMGERSLSFSQALRDLGSLLHRIAIAQQVGTAGEDDADAADIGRLAAAFAPDEVQLYYQITLHGRNEMHLAPDEYAGFTMALLRMLAFAPGSGEAQSAPARPAVAAPARASAATSRAGAAVAQAFDGNWPALVARLRVSGLVRELAQRSELVQHDGDQMKLRVPIKTLLDAGALDKLKAAVGEALGRPIRLTAEVGKPAGPTAAGIADQARAEKQRQAEESIYADPFVRELIENFGASVDPATIRPRNGNDTGTPS